MPNFFSLTIVLALSSQATQERFVTDDDVIYPVLLNYQKAMHRKYESRKSTLPVFSKWTHVESTAAKALFPELKFATVRWAQRIHPEAPDKHAISLVGELGMTISIKRGKNSVQSELQHWGNHESFGQLLIDHHIKLTKQRDAEMIRHSPTFMAIASYQNGIERSAIESGGLE